MMLLLAVLLPGGSPYFTSNSSRGLAPLLLSLQVLVLSLLPRFPGSLHG